MEAYTSTASSKSGDCGNFSARKQGRAVEKQSVLELY